MLLQILLFAIGSAMCGAAQSLNFLIAARSTHNFRLLAFLFTDALSQQFRA